MLDPVGLADSSVAQSLINLDLSLLDSASASVSSSGAAPGVEAEAPDDLRNSQRYRISDLEERFGVFKFAFWRVTPSAAVLTLVSAFWLVMKLAVSEADFSVIRLLHHRKGGVLIRVRCLALKRAILAGHVALREPHNQSEARGLTIKKKKSKMSNFDLFEEC